MKSCQKNGRDSWSRETEVGEKIAVTITNLFFALLSDLPNRYLNMCKYQYHYISLVPVQNRMDEVKICIHLFRLR